MESLEGSSETTPFQRPVIFFKCKLLGPALDPLTRNLAMGSGSSREPLKAHELRVAQSLLSSPGGRIVDRMGEGRHCASLSAGLRFLISENSEMLPEGNVWVSISPDVETGGR